MRRFREAKGDLKTGGWNMRRYLSAVIGVSIAAIPVQAAETDLERRFGAQEGVTQVSLSPDGQLIAFVAPNKGLANDLYVARIGDGERSEEHTSELQSLMRNSYAVFGLK